MVEVQTQPSYYILITSNLRGHDRIVPATEIVKQLVTAGYWLLGARTRNRKRIKPGDKAVFYAAGSGNSVFLASATLATACEPLTNSSKQALPGELLYDLAFDFPSLYTIELSEANLFSKPLPARTLVNHLSFIKNPSYWGSYFQGGSIRIPSDDYSLLVQEGSKQV